MREAEAAGAKNKRTKEREHIVEREDSEKLHSFVRNLFDKIDS